MIELFKPIVDSKGKYLVSNLGRVMIRNYMNRGYTEIVEGTLGTNKYLNVCLKLGRNNFKSKPYTIHRLVLETFRPVDGYEKLTVDHINYNKMDNRLCNLQWLTNEENISKGCDPKLRERIIREQSKTKFKPIIAIKNGVETVYESTKEASIELGLNAPSVTNVLKGRMNHTHGYKFKYLEEPIDNQ